MMYRFEETHLDTGGKAVVTISREEILKYYKSRRPMRYLVLRDEDAIIDDFIVMYWAEEIGESDDE